MCVAGSGRRVCGCGCMCVRVYVREGGEWGEGVCVAGSWGGVYCAAVA